MADTHFVMFYNLRNTQTGRPVRKEVPNDLVYEGKMLYTGERARERARETLKRIRGEPPSRER